MVVCTQTQTLILFTLWTVLKTGSTISVTGIMMIHYASGLIPTTQLGQVQLNLMLINTTRPTSALKLTAT